MKANLTDFIESATVAQLEAEFKRLTQDAEQKMLIRDRAAEEYGIAANKAAICQQILNMKRAAEPPRKLHFSPEGAGAGAPSISQHDQTGATASLTDAVLNAIREGGKIGVEPKDISKMLVARGTAIVPAYLHTILARLKKRNKARSHRGRYFAIESETAAP